MKKMISLFQRNYEGDRLVREEVTPGAEWVAKGEGVATRKWDGTCCLVRGGKLYRRYDAKHGKTPPEGFEASQEPDPTTGHWPGWIPVGDSPQDQWHREAFERKDFTWNGEPIDHLPDGTYELCGPKIGINSEGFSKHHFVLHGGQVFDGCPSSFNALRDWFKGQDIEGVVWHHPDGRMVKIKKKDFGLKRKD